METLGFCGKRTEIYIMPISEEVSPMRLVLVKRVISEHIHGWVGGGDSPFCIRGKYYDLTIEPPGVATFWNTGHVGALWNTGYTKQAFER